METIIKPNVGVSENGAPKLSQNINFEKIRNLSKIDLPSFLLCPPFSFNTKVKNNIWMQEKEDKDLIVDFELAMAQWMDLYTFLSSNGLVTVLPVPYNCNLQDLVFTANLGIVLNEENVVISNFTSKPRKGETKVGKRFFELAGYKNVVVSPYKFEGEADLKYLKNNLYIGYYGIRTEKVTFDWMEEEFNIKIIKIRGSSERCYHGDCSCLVLSKSLIMLCTSLYTKKEVQAIEEHVEIIDVPLEFAECGITNSIRCHNFILNSSDIMDLSFIEHGKDFYLERDKNQFLQDICVECGLEAVFINLSEYLKAGAMLSCNVLSLNQFSYQINLI